jgi:ribosomal protein L32
VSEPEKLDEISDLIDDIESTGQFRAKEITKCKQCGQWKIPHYDQKKRKITFEHVCPAANKEERG